MNFDTVKNLTYETPYFLMSKKTLLKEFARYQKAFGEAEIFYAMKANSESVVLETLYLAGCGFEASSTYELELLKKLRVKPEKVIYGNPIKPPDHLRHFLEYGLDVFVFDSGQELTKLAKAPPGSKVYLRVLVDETGSVFTMSEKFGVEVNRTVELMLKAKELGMVPYGISFNVGSQATNGNAWSNGILSIIPAIEALKKNGIELEVLNIGGGFPWQYKSEIKVPTVEEIASGVNRARKNLPYEIKLILEPGRGLVAPAYALVVSVIGKVIRHDNEWLYIDAGAYNGLLEAMSYQGSIRYNISTLKKYSGSKNAYTLTGPTCDSLDVIDKSAILPVDIQIGDKLLIHDTGAYSISLATAFNGFPTPPTYQL